MIDRERVIKGLQCCVRSDSEAECPTECPYYSKCWEDDYPDGKLALSLHKDALELLGDEPSLVLDIEKYSIYHGKCPACGKRVHNQNTNYCPYCGKAVEWE